ncbi:hypothetical protein [Tropicibacter alexandrii]|uniref:hypothetical protein n=1 Tax=Tropicibacter alexandrii TaxID=2267683 RepID=UPI000EF4478C|nr:hypothetical protein [Tropicibacter alexandrii]
MSPHTPVIGRGAVVSACAILERVIKTNAELESLLLEYGLSGHVGSGGSIAKTMLNLQRFAVQTPSFGVQTDYGNKTLAELLLDLAIRLDGSNADHEQWGKLERYLNLDGFALLKNVSQGMFSKEETITGFTLALPNFVALPESASEVDVLLDRNDFSVAKRHLQSAKENITQADWEAANSQCRTFLEALTNAIADRLHPSEAATRASGLAKRQLLADKGFLSREKHEFGDGNKQTFLPGLAKLLHPDGAHPGISTQYDAMFRLQLVVVTARWMLMRLEKELGR